MLARCTAGSLCLHVLMRCLTACPHACLKSMGPAGAAAVVQPCLKQRYLGLLQAMPWKEAPCGCSACIPVLMPAESTRTATRLPCQTIESCRHAPVSCVCRGHNRLVRGLHAAAWRTLGRERHSAQAPTARPDPLAHLHLLAPKVPPAALTHPVTTNKHPRKWKDCGVARPDTVASFRRCRGLASKKQTIGIASSPQCGSFFVCHDLELSSVHILRRKTLLWDLQNLHGGNLPLPIYMPSPVDVYACAARCFCLFLIHVRSAHKGAWHFCVVRLESQLPCFLPHGCLGTMHVPLCPSACCWNCDMTLASLLITPLSLCAWL